jgi:hypothetical protein
MKLKCQWKCKPKQRRKRAQVLKSEGNDLIRLLFLGRFIAYLVTWCSMSSQISSFNHRLLTLD